MGEYPEPDRKEGELERGGAANNFPEPDQLPDFLVLDEQGSLG
jgi:hypothetical protein